MAGLPSGSKYLAVISHIKHNKTEKERIKIMTDTATPTAPFKVSPKFEKMIGFMFERMKAQAPIDVLARLQEQAQESLESYFTYFISRELVASGDLPESDVATLVQKMKDLDEEYPSEIGYAKSCSELAMTDLLNGLLTMR